MTEPITQFKYRYRFLSNFYPVEIEFAGEQYGSVEHAYQASKTLIAAERVPFSLNAGAFPMTAGAAKKVGQALSLRHDWSDELARDIMKTLVTEKFLDETLRWRLELTDDAVLVEGNWWHDNRWGDCFCGRPECAEPGQNWLGKILMDVR